VTCTDEVGKRNKNGDGDDGEPDERKGELPGWGLGVGAAWGQTGTEGRRVGLLVLAELGGDLRCDARVHAKQIWSCDEIFVDKDGNNTNIPLLSLWIEHQAVRAKKQIYLLFL